MTARVIDAVASGTVPEKAAIASPPVFCVTSGKGGVGKTSITLCLARQIAQACRVLIVDLDYFNRGATGLLSNQTVPAADGIALVEAIPMLEGIDVGTGPESAGLRPPIRVERVEGEEQLWICPCSELSQSVMRGIHDQPIAEIAAALRWAIEGLCRSMELGCVVIDAHGGPDPVSFAACEVADDVLLVTEPDKVTLYGTLNFLSTLNGTPSNFQRGQIHLVFNRVSSYFSWPGLKRMYDCELKDLFASLLAVIPFDEELFDHFGNAPFITTLFPDSIFARKIQSITRRLLLERSPRLVPEEVRNWPPGEAKRVHERLHRLNLARPLPIMVMWLVVLGALFVSSTAGALN